MKRFATALMAAMLVAGAQTTDEAGRLFRDLLIGVTSFFRNPEMFEALRQRRDGTAGKG